MTEPREGWALTSNGRSYRKVTGVSQAKGFSSQNYLTSKQAAWIQKDRYFEGEHGEREAVEAALANARAAADKARKQLANAEKDKARLMKRAKEMEA